MSIFWSWKKFLYSPRTKVYCFLFLQCQYSSGPYLKIICKYMYKKHLSSFTKQLSIAVPSLLLGIRRLKVRTGQGQNQEGTSFEFWSFLILQIPCVSLQKGQAVFYRIINPSCRELCAQKHISAFLSISPRY